MRLFFLLLGDGVEQVWADEEVGTDDGDDADPALCRHFLKGLDSIVDETVLPLDDVFDCVVHCRGGVKCSWAES